MKFTQTGCKSRWSALPALMDLMSTPLRFSTSTIFADACLNYIDLSCGTQAGCKSQRPALAVLRVRTLIPLRRVVERRAETGKPQAAADAAGFLLDHDLGARLKD